MDARATAFNRYLEENDICDAYRRVLIKACRCFFRTIFVTAPPGYVSRAVFPVKAGPT
jgi:hypothetical protein